MLLSLCLIMRCPESMFKSCSICGGIHLFGSGRCQKNRYKIGYDGKPRHDTGHRLRQNSRLNKLVKTFKEDNKNLCALCLLDGVVSSKQIEVHHIEPLKNRPDLAYDYDNLICLCSAHHKLAERGVYSKDYLRKIKPPLGV